jgi:hypothetical protein
MDGLARQESGDPDARNSLTGARGAWQILPSNQAKWAAEAGLSPSAPMTLDNQRIVVRHKLIEYFKAFGNWDSVARAWYAGAGNAHRHSDHKEKGGYPSINSYAAHVLAKVGPLPCG